MFHFYYPQKNNERFNKNQDALLATKKYVDSRLLEYQRSRFDLEANASLDFSNDFLDCDYTYYDENAKKFYYGSFDSKYFESVDALHWEKSNTVKVFEPCIQVSNNNANNPVSVRICAITPLKNENTVIYKLYYDNIIAPADGLTVDDIRFNPTNGVFPV